MKRWSLLLLLLLLPLTMAPRTSILGETFTIDVTTARDSVRVGSAMAVTVKITKVTDERTGLVPLTTAVTVDDTRGNAKLEAVSRGCTVGDSEIGCWIPPLDPDESVTLRFTVTPTRSGTIVMRFLLPDGKELGMVSRRAV